jgi:DNA-binding GntR family transcriptional regulator
MSSPKDIAYRHLRRKIAAGRLIGADRVSDYHVARELGISRAPVREAISQLASEGVVERMERYGAFVRVLSKHEVDSLRRFRSLMECDAVAEAAESITPAQLARLRRLLRDAIACARRLIEGREFRRQSARFLALDQAFHREIVRASGNPWVLKTIREQQTLIQTLGIAAWVPGDDTAAALKRVVKAHRAILAALTRRDPRAAEDAMRRHLRSGAKLTRAEYDRMIAKQRRHMAAERRSRWPRELLSRVASREAGARSAVGTT